MPRSWLRELRALGCCTTCHLAIADGDALFFVGRYDTFKEMILSTGLIGDGIGLYFASSFMAVSSLFFP